jgi:membrane protease subunit HflC
MRARLFGSLGIVIIAAIGLIFYFSFFVVPQTEQALVLRFGQVVAPIGEPLAPVSKPGLYFKLPFIDNVVYFEKRILDLDSPPLEIIASDQKRLVVDAFGRYRIADPLLFYQSVGTVSVANLRLSDILNSAVRRVLGDASFIQLVRDQRAQLMSRITEQANQQTLRLGIGMVDVKIKHADLPEANSQAIYQRMQTERQREATEIRAEGEQQARRIRAEADRTATVIVAEANRESEQLRGDGDAERNRVFAAAFGKDPEFFAFYRSMLAYQAGLGSNDTRMLLSPDSDFFRYFNDLNSGLAPKAPATVSAAPAPMPPAVPAPPAAPSPGPAGPPAAAPVAPPAAGPAGPPAAAPVAPQ